MARPKDGDVFSIPLPDGEFGLAQVLTNDLVVVFQHRSPVAPKAADVASLPVAFRAILTPEFWREKRWTRLGRAPVDPQNTGPIRLWSCRPDFTGYLAEWRYRLPARELGDVGVRKADGSTPGRLSCAEAEVWLFRCLERIPHDPWWAYEREGKAIPWALKRPENYDYSWSKAPQPDTLDAPARDKLRGYTVARASGKPVSDRDSLVAWHGSAADFLSALSDVPSSGWVERVELALDGVSREGGATVDECGEALAAAFLVGVADSAALATAGAPADVIERAPKALKAAKSKLAPRAVRALDAVLSSDNEMAQLLRESADYESFVAQVTSLRERLRSGA